MDSCEITLINRNSCQSCRLKKCLDVGMSRDASRLGRPPKRTCFDMKNIKDSNIWEQQIPLEEEDKQISPTNDVDSTFPDCLFQHRQIIIEPKIHQEIIRKLTSMLIYQEKLLTNIETKEIDRIAEVIINAHLKFSVYTFEKIHIKTEENPPIYADSVVRKKDYHLLFKVKALFYFRVMNLMVIQH
jgi:hypothetical protein